MTQTLTALTSKPSRGRRFWELEFWNATGQEQLATLSQDNSGGIINGMTTRRHANGTCGTGDFEGDPTLLPFAAPRNIIKLTYDTGAKVIPAYFGVIADSPDPRYSTAGVYECISGKDLLKKKVCDKGGYIDYTVPMDAAVFMRRLIELFLPKPLKLDPNRIPLTGVMLDKVDARETQLYKALAAIIEACPSIGENDWGVDPEGYVVIAPATGDKTFTFEKVGSQLNTGKVHAEEICTKATIRLANTVSDGAILSARYLPSVIAYTYTDPAHIVYEADGAFDIPKKTDGTPIYELLEYLPEQGAFTGQAGWTASTNGASDAVSVRAAALDGDLSTYIYPNGAALSEFSSGQYRSPNSPTTVVGLALVLDAPAGTYNLQVQIRFSAQPDGPTVVDRAYAIFDLNYLKGQGKVEVRLIAPPPFDFVNIGIATLTASGGPPSSLKVYEARTLRVNTVLLEQIAKSNIKLPAQEVTEITCARGFTSGGEAMGGFLFETPVKTLRVTGVPGVDGKPTTLVGEIKEIVDTYTTAEGMLSRVALNDKIRSNDVATISAAIARAQEAYS